MFIQDDPTGSNDEELLDFEDDTNFGGNEKPEEEKKDSDEEGKDDEGTKKDKAASKDADKSKSSALVQKKLWRERAKAAEARAKELEEKRKEPEGLSAEEKKELEAQKYLRKLISETLEEREKSQKAKDAEAVATFQEELEQVLEDYDLDEDEVLEICEDLEVMPSKAAKILLRQQKAAGKKEKSDKPDMPKPKRGAETVEKKDEDRKVQSLDDVTRSIKERIRKGEL